jgi:undecaprenyl-diphosphatase
MDTATTTATPAPVRTAVVTSAAVVVLTALVATRWAPLVHLDEAIARSAYAYGLAHPGWVHALTVWTNVFGPWTWRVLAAVLAVVLLVRRDWWGAAAAFTPIVVGGVVELALKSGIGRARPAFEPPLSHAAGGAYPSGHATTAALGCAVLAMAVPPRYRVPAVAAGALIAGLTAYSRVGLAVHWTSDVVGGLLLGVGVVALTRVVLSRAAERVAG